VRTLWLLLILWPLCLRAAEPSPSPIRDTTAVEPVRLPAPAWSVGLRSAVVPGWGQFATGHPIRGTVLSVLDIWTYGDALQRTFQTLPRLRRKARDATLLADQQRSIAFHWVSDTSDSGKSNWASTSSLLKSLDSGASRARGQARISADYRDCEMAWAVGMHLYAVADAAEEGWLQGGGRRGVKDMVVAAWASALLPGAGQIYNERYSKAALLYCGVIGAVSSWKAHQETVDFWRQEAAIARADSASTTTIDQQQAFFRKRRNQYIWGLGLIYVYQIVDAMVDARLSRVDQPFPIALEPLLPDPGLQVVWSF